jgi:hypothetical protein
VRRWVSWGSGNLEGEGWVRGGTREGQFTSNLRPRWTIPVTAGGFQVSRGGTKGKKGTWQGEIKARGNAPCIIVHCNCVRVYIGMIE